MFFFSPTQFRGHAVSFVPVRGLTIPIPIHTTAQTFMPGQTLLKSQICPLGDTRDYCPFSCPRRHSGHTCEGALDALQQRAAGGFLERLERRLSPAASTRISNSKEKEKARKSVDERGKDQGRDTHRAK